MTKSAKASIYLKNSKSEKKKVSSRVDGRSKADKTCWNAVATKILAVGLFLVKCDFSWTMCFV
jgi:hypothetical protein